MKTYSYESPEYYSLMEDRLRSRFHHYGYRLKKENERSFLIVEKWTGDVHGRVKVNAFQYVELEYRIRLATGETRVVSRVCHLSNLIYDVNTMKILRVDKPSKPKKQKELVW